MFWYKSSNEYIIRKEEPIVLACRASYNKKTLAQRVIPLAPGYRTALSSRPDRVYFELHLGWNISHVFFQFGLKALTALPDFITSSVHSVLFSLLAHPQLSIREHATKALSAILSRCEFEVRWPLHMCMYMYRMACMSYTYDWLTDWLYWITQLLTRLLTVGSLSFS